MKRPPAGIVVSTCVLLVVAGVAVAHSKPAVTAPKTGTVGRNLHVTARNLKRGRYSLTLFANKAPTRKDFCQIRLATASRAVTSVSFSARSRIPCYSGFPGSSRGSIKTTPREVRPDRRGAAGHELLRRLLVRAAHDQDHGLTAERARYAPASGRPEPPINQSSSLPQSLSSAATNATQPSKETVCPA